MNKKFFVHYMYFLYFPFDLSYAIHCKKKEKKTNMKINSRNSVKINIFFISLCPLLGNVAIVSKLHWWLMITIRICGDMSNSFAYEKRKGDRRKQQCREKNSKYMRQRPRLWRRLATHFGISAAWWRRRRRRWRRSDAFCAAAAVSQWYVMS